MIKVLFVCMGNICRSPAAEGAMEELVRKELLEEKIQCDSAGTIGYHAGSLPDSRMREHAQQRGYHLNSRSRKFDSKSDFLTFDYIIVMDNDNLESILAQDEKKEFQDKIFKMTDFTTSSYNEVPDPYNGRGDGFEIVMDLVEEGAATLLKKIKKDHNL